jgi:hypothetical protein
LGWKALGVLELTALPSLPEEVWLPQVEEVDALIVGGGNKFYTALNQLWRTKQPQLIIYENLRHLSGKFKSKRLSRLVSLWTNGLIKDRLAFKASLGRSQRQQVTPAYSSQSCALSLSKGCSECGFIHPRNRKGDTFKCLFCQHGGVRPGRRMEPVEV